MEIRTHSRSEILFVYIVEEGDYYAPNFPPQEFDSSVISFLKFLPKDLVQLKSSIEYYEMCFKFLWNNPYNFQVVYDVNFVSYFKLHLQSNQIKVFIINLNSKYLIKNIECLKASHSLLHFYVLVNDGNKEFKCDLENIFETPAEFLSNIIQNQEEIFSKLGIPEYKINSSMFLGYKSLIKFEYFLPTRNNYFSINSLIGNFFVERNLSDEEESKLRKEESSKAFKNPHTFNRQEIFLDQIRKLDYFINIGLKEEVLQLSSGIEAIYAPLIIVAPFFNPDFVEHHSSEKSKEATELITSLKAEQTENYISFHEGKKFEYGPVMASYIKRLANYLDDVSFLHASNFFSPTIRLPMKGKSIYRELSFFRTNAFAHLNNPKNRRNLSNTISKFSDVYSKTSISPKLQSLISKRNSQLILISDLPLEWLSFDKVPLAFTHDICRLPQTSLRGLMSIYVVNSQVKYTVPKNILHKTLVVFGSQEPAFKIWQDECVGMSHELGFKAVSCDSIDSLKTAIETYKPNLLVFDCHGSYDDKIKSTILWIGNEELTPEKIVQHQLSCQLIFLSACGTAPTYGSINTIANAFFEVGCLSVTTTYLPVEINSASILYLRLLNKLSYASITGVHKNWLEFLCHVIRSSFILDKIRVANQSATPDQIRSLTSLSVDCLNKVLHFNNRRDLLFSIDKLINNIVKVNPEQLQRIVPEYLFYSNLGRSDLIFFESWQEKFRKRNGSDLDNIPQAVSSS